jgi:Fic family protein
MCTPRQLHSKTLFYVHETNIKIWITTMTTNSYLKPLATLGDLESRAVLKATVKARAALAELQGLTNSLPNQYMLIATLSLQEARESSEIENIVTTQDELYRSNYKARQFTSASAKEVHDYAVALTTGFNIVQKTGLLTNSTICKIQKNIEHNNVGFRKQGGTVLKNEKTDEVIHTPPQTEQEVLNFMGALEAFINNDDLSDYDELVKMALIHHQFESIHPFDDGNGRTGRIINILYLCKQGLLDTPILYISSYLNQHKPDYYKHLQHVRETGDWEEWILYMLKAVQITSQETLRTIKRLLALMQEHKHIIKATFPKMYSHELINHLFTHPYTKVEFAKDELDIHRNTARNYLNKLVEVGILDKIKHGNEYYYLNTSLCGLFKK